MTEREIFAIALQKSAGAERAAYLAAACGQDGTLRARIEDLLDEQQCMGNFLERPAVDRAVTINQPPIERPGSQIGPYKILEQIGEGGFGVVFMAEQSHPIRRKVALKVIKPGMDSGEVVARFEAERQALALMDHPNIAHVFDAGTTLSGRSYFVMELVRGAAITEYCDSNRFGPRDRLELFVRVCQAVQHAHQKGVIHRDIKPSNVLVTVVDGEPLVKVIDFGIAKATTGQNLTERTLRTGYTQLLGTPLYISPEQAELGGLDIDTRSDIYSLGVLLYELLTGTTPFDRERLQQATFDEVRRIIRYEEPARPSGRINGSSQATVAVSAARRTDPKRLRQFVRGELDWIVMKSLEKDRNRRYETANAFAADVQRYLRNEPVSACPPSAWYRLGKVARRNKTALLTASLVILGLAIGTVIATWQAIRAERGWIAEQVERQRAVRAERVAKERLFEAKRAQAKASRWSGRVGQRFESLTALTEASSIAREFELDESQISDLRDEAVACLALTDARMVREWKGWPDGTVDFPAFEAELRCYARSDLKGNISVRRVEDDAEIGRLPGPGKHAVFMEFSPDGQLLAVRYRNSQRELRVWNWQRATIRLHTEGVRGDRAFSFSPDGGRLAVSTDEDIVVYNLSDGTESHRLAGAAGFHVAFDPSGTKLARTGLTGGRVVIQELASGTVLHELTHPMATYNAAWHPGGALLAVACEDFQVHVWNLVSGERHALLSGHQASPVGLGFTQDGTMLWSWAWDQTVRLWDPWTGRLLLTCPGVDGRLSRTGRQLVSRQTNQVCLWEVAGDDEYFTLANRSFTRGTRMYHEDAAISADGRWLSVASRDGVRLWNLQRKEEAAFLPIGRTDGLAFHPQTGYLVTLGTAGLCIWPFREEGEMRRLGPPEQLLATGVRGRVALSHSGSVLAAGGEDGVRVLNPDNPSPPQLLEHGNAFYVAVSPNGRWIATGTHLGSGLKIWDAKNGAEVCDLLPSTRPIWPRFSPNGRCLATQDGTGLRFWEAETWQLQQQLPFEGFGTVSWQADGKLMAAPSGPNRIQLLDVANRPLVNLEDRHGQNIAWVGLTPEGSQLVTIIRQPALVRIWDLRSVRTQLAKMGLDWDLAPYGPLDSSEPPRPIPVRLETADGIQRRADSAP